MLSRKFKVTFFLIAGPLMKLNGLFYRIFRAPKKGIVKVHLGPGQERYLNGWINVDANMFTGKCDVWADLRNPLPFYNSTVDAVYSHHVIEHLPDVFFHLSEVFRCLKSGGVYRVGGPSGDSAISKYIENDASWFDDYPDNRSSIGGRFENFIFCRGEHLTILTFSMLKEFMTEIGFTDIILCKPVLETINPHIFSECLAAEYESDFDYPHTLIVEAKKP